MTREDESLASEPKDRPTAKSPITTHILDLGRGRPAAGVEVILARRLEEAEKEHWQTIGRGTTDGDGRAGNLLATDHVLEVGAYRLRFALTPYFARKATRSFYPHVDIVFEISAPEEHHHVPLLLNAHGYSTYRGS